MLSRRSILALVLLLAILPGLLLSACVQAPDTVPAVGPVSGAAADVVLGDGVVLHLPGRPGFPADTRLTQLITARYGDERRRFQADLDLGAEMVRVAFSVPGGVPVLGIRWSMDGILVDRQVPALPDLDVARVLGDIFLAFWPVEQVRRQLDPGAAFTATAGKRTLTVGDRSVLQITTTGPDARRRTVIRNHDQGYELIILSRVAKAA